MIGLLFLFVVGIWIYFAVYLSQFVVRRLPEGRWRTWVRIIVVIVVIPLPLADEIIAERQFKKLCEENAEIILDTTNTQGKTVWFGNSERTQIVLGTINVTQAKRNYVDATTQEPIYHYFRFEATSGWLMKILRVPENSRPLLFQGFCQPKTIETIDKKLGLIHINRPTSMEIK